MNNTTFWGLIVCILYKESTLLSYCAIRHFSQISDNFLMKKTHFVTNTAIKIANFAFKVIFSAHIHRKSLLCFQTVFVKQESLFLANMNLDKSNKLLSHCSLDLWDFSALAFVTAHNSNSNNNKEIMPYRQYIKISIVSALSVAIG